MQTRVQKFSIAYQTKYDYISEKGGVYRLLLRAIGVGEIEFLLSLRKERRVTISSSCFREKRNLVNI